jgi:hypothetical protein
MPAKSPIAAHKSLRSPRVMDPQGRKHGGHPEHRSRPLKHAAVEGQAPAQFGSTATLSGLIVPVMKLWFTFCPSRSARPIVPGVSLPKFSLAQ